MPSMSKLSRSSPPKAYVTAQSLGISTFVAPPLDETMYLPEWIDWHLEHSGQHPYSILIGEDKEENVIVTWAEVTCAVHRWAGVCLRNITEGPADVDGKPRRIGILANVDTLTYATVVMALLRAGLQPFPLSPRNSLSALQHLVTVTNCSYLVGSCDRGELPSTSLEETTRALLDSVESLKLLKVPKYSTLYPRLSTWPPQSYDFANDRSCTQLLPPVKSLPSYRQADYEWPALILHSSGSTSFPKPIHFNHRALLSSSAAFWYGDVDIGGKIWANMSLPPFHSMGVDFSVGIPMSTGTVSAMFRPSDPPKFPTPEGSLDAIKRSGAEYMLIAPSFCEVWSEDPNAIKILASLKAVIYGGGPLPVEKGDRLVQGGVNLLFEYGTTEAGYVFKLIPKHSLGGRDWCYAEFAPDVRYELLPEVGGLSRLVILQSDPHAVCVCNMESPRGFDTNDLLEEHPIHKGYWKVVGRADDQIVMSTGEKTNPGPLEAIIAGSPSVRSAILFGRSQAQVGVVIEPAGHIKVTNVAELEAYRNMIWPDVEKANLFAPTHSRLFKEFILVTDASNKPFVRTPKGTVARNAVLKQFSEEIDELYNSAGQAMHEDPAELPKIWDADNIRAFVSEIVNGVMRCALSKSELVDDSRDLFEQGCDSLQAMHIRNSLWKALCQARNLSHLKHEKQCIVVQQNFVFAHPTVHQLTEAVFQLLNGRPMSRAAPDDMTTAHTAAMLAMVEKYASDLPFHQPCGDLTTHVDGEIVLLTGTTGTLGTYLLERLLLDPKVQRVYALNRHSHNKDILARQREAFEDKELGLDLLLCAKVVLLEGDACKEDFGLGRDMLEQIRSSVTVIIHNAWRLDFNLSLSSFDMHIKATRNLINLSLSSLMATPPQFIFMSSISTLANWHKPCAVPEEPIADPEVALETGYSESKWVAERVLIAAAETRGLKVIILRIEQLAGSTGNGSWNTTDWVPIMAKAGRVMGALPSLPDTSISWLPIDKAAEIVVDVLHGLNGTGTAVTYLHLVHPRPSKWDLIFQALAAHLSLPLIPYSDWVTLLQTSSSTPDPLEEAHRNPAIKLLPFFRGDTHAHESIGGDDKNAGKCDMGTHMSTAECETRKTVALSETMRGLEVLGVRDVERWMGYWGKHGLFD